MSSTSISAIKLYFTNLFHDVEIYWFKQKDYSLLFLKNEYICWELRNKDMNKITKSPFIIIHYSSSKYSFYNAKQKEMFCFLSSHLSYADGNSRVSRPHTNHEIIQKFLLVCLKGRQDLQKQLRHGQGTLFSLAESPSAFLYFQPQYPR